MARIPIRMPKMSMTMTEGEVASWTVEVGDVVSTGDVVCEVMTDKVDMEVESTGSGSLVEIVVREGIVPVGEPIAWLEGEEEGLGDLFGDDPSDPAGATTEAPQADTLAEEHADTAVPADAVATSVPTTTEQATPVETGATPVDERPPAAVPRARGLAHEHGIDLRTVSGSGPDGLITVADVESRVAPTAATASRAAPAPVASAPTVSASTVSASTAPARPAPAAAAEAAVAAVKPDRAAKIRAAVARKMTESAAVPQFTVWRDVVLDKADTRRGGVSWTTTLLQAYAAAMREIPELLCRWDAATSTSVPSGPPAVALAVATSGGLIVPVFAEPDVRDPHDLDREIKSVVGAAHRGRLDPSYFGIANGSLSNLGGMGVDRFQALVTPPQASVLALGSIRPRPVAVPGGVGVALTLTAGLTVDHRVGDGAHAADLMNTFIYEVTGERA